MKFKRRAMKADVPSVAMGDIAFNLLIFFVILAKAQDDAHLEWQPAPGTKLEEVREAKVTVVIDNANKLYLNGKPIGQAQLAGLVEERLGEAERGKRTVLLKVHREATAMYYEPVIESISEAGGELVHILEEKRE
jgi:biopolymer transport protein ExbD